MRARPNLFIVGAPKCGTTSLYEYLRGHPDIYMSPVKEPGYFSDTGGGPARHAATSTQALDQYLSFFAGAGTEKVVGEASVGYIYATDAPARIREFEPAARIIIMLRNPVDMLQSLHRQRLLEGREDLEDFAEALASEAVRRNGRRLPRGVDVEGAMYRDRAEFARHLRRWYDVFGRDRVHVVIFEDLVARPRETFRGVLEFLGVDPAYEPPAFDAHNQSSRPRSSLLVRLRKTRLAQWIAWRFMPAVLGEKRARQIVSAFHHSRLNRRQVKRAELSAQVRRQLEVEFAAEVAALSELLGRDLGTVWFPAPAPSAAEAQLAWTVRKQSEQ